MNHFAVRKVKIIIVKLNNVNAYVIHGSKSEFNDNGELKMNLMDRRRRKNYYMLYHLLDLLIFKIYKKRNCLSIGAILCHFLSDIIIIFHVLSDNF